MPKKIIKKIKSKPKKKVAKRTSLLIDLKKPVRAKKIVKKTQESQKKKTTKFALIRGMKDVLPKDQKYWDLIMSKVEKLAPIYGFSKINTPILEETSLFKRAVGEDTDIVEKEMFSFTDQSGDEVCLRPEFTASIVRAYIEHGMLNRPQPVKFWYWGPVFRYGRPQTGRLRQFNQFGFEVIGSPGAVIDSQLIILFYKLCEELKLKVTAQINSIGCPNCRPEYKRVLVDYLKIKKNFLCEDCKNRVLKNPLRVLDCKNEECQRLVAEAPQIVDFLCEDCKSHFIKVLEGLDECGIPYNLNSKLVRGLDYYTRTVFEFWPVMDDVKEIGDAKSQGNNKGDINSNVVVKDKIDHSTEDFTDANNPSDPSNLALGGGGRYDGLVEILGGREETPASGFAVGIERIILMLKKQGAKIPDEKTPNVFLAQLGDQARKVCLKLFEDLRVIRKNVRIAENLSKDGLKPQLEQANKLGVKYTLIVGQKEILDRTIIIRDMESGVQEIVDFDRAAEELKKRLK